MGHLSVTFMKEEIVAVGGRSIPKYEEKIGLSFTATVLLTTKDKVIEPERVSLATKDIDRNLDVFGP
jgi:hypothetical protein